MQKFTTFLMFYGNAGDAIDYYTSVFENSEIKHISRYGKNQSGKEGTVQFAVVVLNGQEFMMIDSNVSHDFTFTPAISIYIKCDSEEEVDKLFRKLNDGGKVLMPLDKYPFSEKYGWVTDKFGVSWQISLSK